MSKCHWGQSQLILCVPPSPAGMSERLCESVSDLQFPAMLNPGQNSYLDFSLGGMDSTSITVVLLILARNVRVISPVCTHASAHSKVHVTGTGIIQNLCCTHCPAWNSDTSLPASYVRLCVCQADVKKSAGDCRHQNENIFLVKNTRFRAIF